MLGTPVIVENKPGALEQLAALPVASATPDGHTLWLRTASADFGFPTVATGTPFVRDGRIKALVVTGTQRAKALPNVPSLAEDGPVESLKRYGTYSIYALLGPAGVPASVTGALNDALTKISTMPDVVQKLELASLRATASTSAELTQYIEREVAKWKEVGKKVKLD